ncbi:unnamed protein product [Penicillium salamii]|uniref:ASST-domain-containing protein n=1 Tax=Penicillium salamii TaxID=1612424 RepID=A0A9W4JAF5_9EURO|nr:unnamed protein product [Penicillium salamii]CAG8384016.1 unnamed protein product [Penicillium salamii]CAG8384818.1 unnamed protein product [Penicillium salamii]CAG8385347.1 unnamed protein product [Penicillium salamii]
MRIHSNFVALCGLQATLASASTAWPWQTYKSSPHEPPSLQISKSGPTSPGYLFFDQSWDAHQYSVFIMSDSNELVWQSPRGDLKGFRVQQLDGKPVLTYFNGLGVPEPFGWGYGIIQVLDQSYNSIYNVSVINDNYTALGSIDSSSFVSWIDMHENTMTSDGTMLVTGYNVTKCDLSSVGGPKNGWIADSLFYEIDVKTNDILFRWSAKDHLDQIPLEDVQPFYPIEDWGHNSSAPYGYFHINSVEKFKDGSYLISSRYYCSLFKVAKDGSVDWTLQVSDAIIMLNTVTNLEQGETGGDFKLNGIQWAYQHDGRIHHEHEDGFVLSIFDNANSDVSNGTHFTEGMLIYVNLATREASSLKTLHDPKDEIYAVSQGNTQILPGNHAIMGYGSNPKIKEYNANGTCVMTAQFGEDGVVASYRAYRSPWVGIPITSPDVASCFDQAHNKTNVFMSWNGATENQNWKIFGGHTRGELRPVSVVRKTGFETTASVAGGLKFVRVEAHGRGIEKGISKVISVEKMC